jgi:pimeloyl-ACP methyl ester carboxylesterase
LAPGWPDEPDTVEAARMHPEAVAGKGLREATNRYAAVLRKLKRPAILIGHSFGGLIAEKLLARGLGAAAIAIDAAPFRGVLPLPLSALKSALPVLANPANVNRAVSLTEEQFRFSFGNALSADEAAQLYAAFAIPSPGRPVFQAATANIHPRTTATVDYDNPHRGPLLLISGANDNTVPFAITDASYKRFKESPAVTELRSFADRGHSLIVDHGWRELAECSLDFVHRHAL